MKAIWNFTKYFTAEYTSTYGRDTLWQIKKKFKNTKFAAGCSRDVIQKGADMLGWELDDLIEQTIEALKTFRP